MGPYFIDFEAFQHGEEHYRIKELCILDVDRPLSPLYFIFAADKSWDALRISQQKTYSFQSRHIHGLGYDEGVTLYCSSCVARLMKQTFPNCLNGIFYVMGLQKMNFLITQFPKFNFCEYHVTFNILPQIAHNISCLHRNHSAEHCACLKCYRLYQHYITLSSPL